MNRTLPLARLPALQPCFTALAALLAFGAAPASAVELPSVAQGSVVYSCVASGGCNSYFDPSYTIMQVGSGNNGFASGTQAAFAFFAIPALPSGAMSAVLRVDATVSAPTTLLVGDVVLPLESYQVAMIGVGAQVLFNDLTQGVVLGQSAVSSPSETLAFTLPASALSAIEAAAGGGTFGLAFYPNSVGPMMVLSSPTLSITSAVPEPAGAALLLAGCGLLLASRSVRRVPCTDHPR